MEFIKRILGKKDKKITSYNDFWNWFLNNEKTFYSILKKNKNVEKDFLDTLSNKIKDLRDGYFFETGMFDDNTAELIVTADGEITNIVFVEELVNAAPKIDGWLFTSLKPALSIENVNIEMSGYTFNESCISFFPNDNTKYPDEIDITVVHNDFNENNKSTITRGIYIFIDSLLGELNSIITVDNMVVSGTTNIKKELIPIRKLKDYLTWRQNEFIEKYEGIRHNSETDVYSTFEAKHENGNVLIALINTDLLSWDNKASHPWILRIEIKYDGENNRGMPDDNTYQLLNEIEDNISSQLKDFDGYLYIGRQTAQSVRTVYFACKDFRKPSKIMNEIIYNSSSTLEISFSIYKDKYWQSFERFCK